MGWLTNYLLDRRLRDLLRLVRKPHMIPIVLSAPPSMPHLNTLCALFPKLNKQTAEEYMREFLSNMEYFAAINSKVIEKRKRRPNVGQAKALFYSFLRHLKPEVVVETGVFDGEHSAAMLLALHENEKGTLVSIDLPAVKPITNSTNRYDEVCLPPGCEPGWAIPDYLRDRFKLVQGDSRHLLPKVLEEYPQIDVFLHDSLHTYDHMMFEYTTAWSALSDGGFLVSHDIFSNRAFHKFYRQHKTSYIRVETWGIVKKFVTDY